jgi:hypothetical protein
MSNQKGERYKDKMWLRNQYTTKGLGTRTISKSFGVSPAAIIYYVKKFGLAVHKKCLGPRRGAKLLYRKESWLRNKYVSQQWSSCRIAKFCNIGNRHVLRWMNRYGISRRDFPSQGRILSMSPRLVSIIEGELLGDGHVRMVSPNSAVFTYGCKHKNHALWLIRCFSDEGVSFINKGRPTKHVLPQNGNTAYFFSSLSYPQLVEIRRRWYPNGKKVVPLDIALNETSVRHWFIGDGTTFFRKSRPYRPSRGIFFCTHSFTFRENHRLARHLLNDLGIRASVIRCKTKRRLYFNLRLGEKASRLLLNTIGKCPSKLTKEYGHKWKLDG